MPQQASREKSIAHVLQTGLAYQREGRLFFAEACYRKILQIDPQHPDALYLLGMVAQQAGRYEIASKLIAAAIRANPVAAHYRNSLGNTYFRLSRRAALKQTRETPTTETQRHRDGQHTNGANTAGSPAAPSPQKQLELAMECYRQALALRPEYAEAHYNLGDALLRQGDDQAACECYRHAVALKPDCAHFHCGLGRVLQRQGNAQAAEEYYRRVLEIQPDYAERQHNLGNALFRRGELEEAAECYRCALALKPDLAETHTHLAGVLAKQGDIAGALQNYRRAVQLKPDFAEAYTSLGILLDEQGDLAGAEDACRRAVAAKPGSALVHSNLAAVLDERGCLAEATESCRRALTLNPGLAAAHSNLAGILWRQCDFESSVAACRRAIALNPTCAAAYCNLGSALSDQGDLEEGLRCYQRALEAKPDWATALFYTGLTLLLQGNFAQGWQDYEQRWRLKHWRRREFSQPLWLGEPLEGARILLHAEQGLGDTLQFVRYVPLVAARGGKVILEVPPRLRRLLSGLEGAAEVISRGQDLPEFTWQCPLMSLPLAFGTELATIPADVPYIHADPARVQAWSQRLERTGLRVGLVWAGSPKHVNDRQRSLPLARFTALTQIPGASFYALQKGHAAAETQPLPPGMRLIDLGPEQSNMAETAAIIANLDLVISVDTSVAHLAGALGKPVWILLHYVPDWRWLLHREDSPWYPTARLFRQPKLRDWDPVLQRVEEELARYRGTNFNNIQHRTAETQNMTE